MDSTQKVQGSAADAESGGVKRLDSGLREAQTEASSDRTCPSIKVQGSAGDAESGVGKRLDSGLRQKWQLRRAMDSSASIPPWQSLQDAFALSERAARLAWLRHEDETLLQYRIHADFRDSHDPYRMDDMGKAVDHIRAAILAKTPMCVYGDYDVDGVTATALLVRVLERLGANVDYFIPNRFNDGYGLHMECIQERVSAKGPCLFISVDCGIRSVEEVKQSLELGLNWIITDHHALGPDLPPAIACLHPLLGDTGNPHLAGVGVAFKLAQALLDAAPIPKGSDIAFLDGLLKLVAIGSVADMVRLQGENALLVKRGLKALGAGNGPGIQELFKLARIQGVPRATDIAFGVSPRLNAVGRMGGAQDAVRLLLTRSPEEAAQLALQVDQLNTERKRIQDALNAQMPPYDGQPFDLVLFPEAHKGVLGIVASRRMRDIHRPVGVGSILDGVAHCSLRAPKGYDLTELLNLVQPFLKSGGGHAQAAGISFDKARLAFIRQGLNRGAEAQSLGVGPSVLEVDGLGSELCPDWEDLLKLEPFGQGFPEACFVHKGPLQEAPQAFGAGHCRFRIRGADAPFTWFYGQEQSQSWALGQELEVAVHVQEHPRFGRSFLVEHMLSDGAAREVLS